MENIAGHSQDLLIPIIMLAAAVFVTSFMHRLRLSPILGYLLAGLLIGPYGLGLLQNTPIVQFLADLGVVFLLFAIGLELPLERLRVMRHLVFGFGGISTLFFMMAFGIFIFYLYGQPREAIVIGGALAFSSTALLIQLLSERGEFSTRYGRASFAAALFQDLAVVPLLVIFPIINESRDVIASSLIAAAIKAVIALVLIMYIGKLVLRPFYRIVIGNRNHELFTAMTLLVVLGLAFTTYHFGLSMALGAFLAGVILSETEFRHQIAADIEPFRGLFLGLFFMTVGMMIDINYISGHALEILAYTAGLIAVKLIVFTGLAQQFSLPRPKAIKTGILLSQGGEFAFVLFGIAGYHQLISKQTIDLFSSVVILSMVATPILARIFWPRLDRSYSKAEGDPPANDAFPDKHNHIIIAGFGRVGEVIAMMLSAEAIPYVVIDDNHERVARARAAGLPVFFGDASKAHVLRSVGIEQARAVAVAVSSPKYATRIVHVIRENWPKMPIFGRARDPEHAKKLIAAGVTATVPITLHASLELGSTLLESLGRDRNTIDKLADTIREIHHQEVI